MNKKYFFLSAEPYLMNIANSSVAEPSYPNHYTEQNQEIRPSERPGGFKWLNDRQLDSQSEIKSSGIREFQFYIK